MMLLLPLLLTVLPAMVLSSLVDYENPGPRYTSAEDDSITAVRLAAIVFGVFDKPLVSHLEYLRGGGSKTTNYAHSGRRQLQGELATFLLSIIEAHKRPLPKDKATAVADAVTKSGFLGDIKSSLQSTHRNADDKKLIEAMCRSTSVDFAGRYCSSQKAYSDALFTAEVRALSLLKDQELLKKLGLADRTDEFKRFHTHLLVFSKQIKDAVQSPSPTNIFARNPNQAVEERGNLEFLQDHLRYGVPERASNALSRAKMHVKDASVEALKAVGSDMQDLAGRVVNRILGKPVELSDASEDSSSDE